jgi:hypothetical protein
MKMQVFKGWPIFGVVEQVRFELKNLREWGKSKECILGI